MRPIEYRLSTPLRDQSRVLAPLKRQPAVVTDGDEALARRAAEEMAADFWENRAKTQIK